MHVDLSPLLKAATRSSRRRRGFTAPALFSLPEVAERSERIASRHLETTPYRVLDTPGLVDDYYLNLLDWNGNRISVAIGDTVYSYNTETKDVTEIFTTQNEYISSIKSRDSILVIGDSSGKLYLYDLEKRVTAVREHHTTRICSTAISERTISTGARNGLIVNIDTRSSTAIELHGHSHEVCGLRWNNEYLASGSNDNTVRIWKAGSMVAKVLRGHESAVKALDWCPWKGNVLATGGGTKDKNIKFWDIHTGKCTRSVAVQSQVCGLSYLRRYKEIVTAHGFQENDLKLWKAGDMKLISTFGSHEGRVLHTALSPDECSIVSLGSDDSLKFWKLAEPVEKTPKRDSIGMR